MKAQTVESTTIELSAIDGANPLGFLCALGTLVTLHAVGAVNARLAWRRAAKWVPVISGTEAPSPFALSETLANALRGRDVPVEAGARCAEAQAAFEAAKKNAADKRKQIRKRAAAPSERRAAIEVEVTPLERERDEKRDVWLEALANAVPRRELALGKRLDCTSGEYRDHAAAFLTSAGASDREAADLLAAFGSDACLAERSEAIEPTPFQFITGSGHQFFLETVGQLIANVTAPRVQQALFEAWEYRDDGLSMRWDPIEDRRYALMDRDPTASGNKARTVWMANLLAYRALALFPAAPRQKQLGVTAWARGDDATFTWPLWTFPAAPDTLRSMLQLRELSQLRPDPEVLRARGIAAALRARRIKVGTGANFKLNFTPARVIASAEATSPHRHIEAPSK